MTKIEFQDCKRQIVELLKSTQREGVEKLLRCLDDRGYYTAKCHSHHHYFGGMMKHSLGVCKLALSKAKGLSRDSIIICSLLHDLCDITGYSQFCGHGVRSMRIALACGLELSSAEKCAIRNHMRKPHEISPSWDNVLAVQENRALYEVIYKADKRNAKSSPRR